MAIREWALVEHWMHQAMATYFQEVDQPMLGRGFVALQGFHSKWLFAHNAIDRALTGKAALKEWKVLSDRLKKKAEIRNKLVHNMVREFPSAKPSERIASCPWTHKKGIDLSKPYEGCVCIIAVVKARLEFVALHCALGNFVARSFGGIGPHPEAAEHAKNPPTFRQLMRQIHEELGHPQRSAAEKRAATDAANAAASLRTPLPGARVGTKRNDEPR